MNAGLAATLLSVAIGLGGSDEIAAPRALVRCEGPDSAALERSLSLYLQTLSPQFVTAPVNTLERLARVESLRFALWCELTARRTLVIHLLDTKTTPSRASQLELSADEVVGSDLARLVGLKARSLIDVAQLKSQPATLEAGPIAVAENAEPRFHLGAGPELTASSGFGQALFGVSGHAAVRIGFFRAGLTVRWYQAETRTSAIASGTTQRLQGTLWAALRLPGVSFATTHFVVVEVGALRLATVGTLLATSEHRGTVSVTPTVSAGWQLRWHVGGPFSFSVMPRAEVATAPATVTVQDSVVFTMPCVSPALDLRIWLDL